MFGSALTRRLVPRGSPLRLEPLAKREQNGLVLGLIAALFALFCLALWAIVSPETMSAASAEDGWIENLSALFFLAAAGLFLLFAKRCTTLALRGNWMLYACTSGWAALAFICAGEEISWGQRLLGFATPEEIAKGNRQGEFNVHNHVILEYLIGRHGWRAASVLTFATGVVLPILAQTAGGRRLFQRVGLPVPPLAYSPLFVASYVFLKLMFETGQPTQPAGELREMLLAAGFFAFALHGAVRPNDLLRVRS